MGLSDNKIGWTRGAASTADVNTGTDASKYITPLALKSSNYIESGDAASSSEIDTGTDTTKYVSPDALEGSKYNPANNVPVTQSSPASVQTVSDVEARTIEGHLYGSAFTSDLLNGGATYTAVIGNKYLERINTAGTISWNIATATGTTETPTANTESVFDLTALGTISAVQVKDLATLGVTATTSDAWEDIAGLTGYAATIWPYFVPSKVTGYQPKPLIGEVLRNSGNNIALFGALTEGYYRNAAGTTASADYLYGDNYIPVMPSTQYATQGITHIVGYDKDKANAANVTITSNQFTTGATTRFIRVSALIATYTAKTYSIYAGIYVANTNLSEPLNDGLVLGSRSVNLGGTYDGTDEIEFTAPFDGVFTLATMDTAETWASDAVVQTAETLTAGETKTWTGLGASVDSFMVLEGEYTQAQARALGYVEYNPIVLHTDGEGTTDELLLVDGKEHIKHNLEVDSDWDYGDPVVDTTNKVTNGEFTTDTTGWASSAGTISRVDTTTDPGVPSGGSDSYVLKFIATSASGRYISTTLTVATEIGKRYMLKFNYYNVAASTNMYAKIGTLTLTPHIGNESTKNSWKTVIYNFIATDSSVSLLIGILSAGGAIGNTFYIDSISFNDVNIYPATTPTLEDISEFVRSGSLLQPASQGLNHVVSLGTNSVELTHKQGIAGALDGIKDTMIAKADKTVVEGMRVRPLKLTTTAGIAGSASQVFLFKNIANFPDYIENCTLANKYDTDTNFGDAIPYPNALVVVADATGIGAGDVLGVFELESTAPLVSHEE